MGDAPVGVLAEDVAHDHHRLLHHVAHAPLDELHQHVDAALRRHIQLHGAPPDGAHRLRIFRFMIYLKTVRIWVAEPCLLGGVGAGGFAHSGGIRTLHLTAQRSPCTAACAQMTTTLLRAGAAAALAASIQNHHSVLQTVKLKVLCETSDNAPPCAQTPRPPQTRTPSAP